jgi:nitronate monooxygenase
VVLDALERPVVLAPLAGGPSTPELAAAVSEVGGLGFLAFGYLSAHAAAERLAALRALTHRPFGVNLFVPGPRSPADVGPYVERLRAAGLEPLGEPRWDDDGWEAKLALVREQPPAVVLFTFGCPPADVVAWLDSEVWVTVTSPREARLAAEAGADALVVQGAEAGGHCGSFEDRDQDPAPLAELLPAVREAVSLPLVATGGIMTAAHAAAALAAGAAAVQAGTAFLLCPEAGTAEVHRRRIASNDATELTRAFTGRLARGIRNRFMADHSDAAPSAYPDVHYVTAPLRARGRAEGDPELVNLWAGTNHHLAQAAPAADIVRALTPR